MLASCVGAGALIGALVLASRGSVRRQGAIILTAAVALAAFTAILGLAHWLWLAIPFLVLIGVGQTIFGVLTTNALLDLTEEDYRGRVMSLLFLQLGFFSIGSVAAGLLADRFGAGAALTMLGSLGVLAALLQAATNRRRRRF